VEEILGKIQQALQKEVIKIEDSVSCIPEVTQDPDGLPNVKKIRRKEAVTQTA
jgi:hypothetical protein